MNFEELKQIVEPILRHAISPEQEDIIKHSNGPLWIIAGPGSGKSEVLVIRTLKLIFVDGINPKSIVITTFTEKAARNLFDRISNYASYIFERYPGLTNSVDIDSLRIGTLHSLCNNIMLEHRYPDYENYRLLDEMEQILFIYEHSSFVTETGTTYLPLCEQFAYLFDGWDPVNKSKRWSDHSRLPNKWRRTKASVRIFNRIVEDMIDVDKMRNESDTWNLLVNVYLNYRSSMDRHRRCDFAHLQEKFLNFLNSPSGKRFLSGDGTDLHPGIQYVMVDEYQDTNPIQESIYFNMANHTHNLCVVGDDDQALYRFRGGTVDCMVNFDKKCETEWNISFDDQKWQKFLSNNYRSHSGIVDYYNDYINSFAVMNLEGARVRGKPRLNAQSSISGDYPAVAYITGKTIERTANNFSIFIRGLLDNNIISNPNQCVLLMKSVRETDRYAGHFARALREVGISPYNPRSRTYLENEEITGILGAFISIIDPELNALRSIRGEGIDDIVRTWIQSYEDLASDYPNLADYVNLSKRNISRMDTDKWLDATILDMFYHMLSYEPFSEWKNDYERSYRLGKMSKLFEAYSSIPYPTTLGSNRGKLKISSTNRGEISFRWRQNFYYSLVGLLVSEGINDPEDEDIISPANRLPIMTVHQAKGLQFDFVFVYGLSNEPHPGSTIKLEKELSQFRKNSSSAIRFNEVQKAEQDLVRFYFVAYSRPKYALIHLVPKAHINNDKVGFINKSVRTFRDAVRNLGG